MKHFRKLSFTSISLLFSTLLLAQGTQIAGSPIYHSSITVNIGGLGNGILKVRAIEGKKANSDAADDLYLNYYSMNNVHIGGNNRPANLFVHGNIGIGLTVPTELLHIKSGSDNAFLKLESDGLGKDVGIQFDTNSGQDWKVYLDESDLRKFKIQESGTDFLSIDVNGHVGIGTVSPQHQLDISKTGADATLRVQDGVSGAPIRLRSNGSGEASIYIGNENSSIRRSGGDLRFWANGIDMEFSTNNGSTKHMFLNAAGNLGIGTTTPGNKLEVNGTIRSKSVKVEAINWPDYVFASDFKLRPLSEVEAFINSNEHLPDVPSAKEVEEKGLNLGEMDATLLKKIEELTLYMIEMKKEIEVLKKKNQELEEKANK